MKTLKERKVWSCFNGTDGKYIATDGTPATSENLVSFAEAAGYMYEMVNGNYPPNYSVALSLDAAQCIAVTLYNAWDTQRAQPVEGAQLWMSTLNGYTELCHANSEGERAIRLICRGVVPEGAELPARVKITTSGNIPITTERIPARPTWQQADDGGVIKDVTEGLEQLCVPKRPCYIRM